jgi:hypothetical protein
MPNDRRTISSGALSSGSSIADAKGCKCSGLCESKGLSIVKERVYGKWGAPLYQVSSHSQSIAEHFEQKCLSDDASLSCGVPRSNTALYILSSPTARTRALAVSHCRKRRRNRHPHEMSPFPLVIWSVSACAPRLIDPPVPPTLRQIEHIQS